MTIRRALILTPLVVILVLMQSYFWVPTYEQQTKGNPDRLRKYINASIGDAALLNPILSADSASSTIENLVFEGLIDRDKDLRYRGRLATHWNVFEEAYFYVNQNAVVNGIKDPSAADILEILQTARSRASSHPSKLQWSLSNIEDITIIPPKSTRIVRQVPSWTNPQEKTRVTVKINTPARLKLTLKQVDQELFIHLDQLFGGNYFAAHRPANHVSTEPDMPDKQRLVLAQQLLPAVEHNPVIVFHLRRGVKFHDGHIVDADDVRFTYTAIMNPKNLSPRIADYEPVKQVDVLDPLTVRIVYKRLYSPAIGTWAMGILPEHLLNEKAMSEEARRRNKDPKQFSMRQSRFSRHPIGCGPFVFKEWKSDQYIRLDRFEDYWEGPPNYEEYVLRIVPDLLTQEMEFYAGTIDSYGVQPHQVGRLSSDERFQSFSGTAFGYTYIGYNLRREPFNDRRVRTALGMAIDVDKIIKFVLYGQGDHITGPFVKQTDYYNHAITPLAYDPQGAVKLLEQVGWVRGKQGYLEKNGKRLQFTLITNSGNDLRKAILAIAQDGWKRIGVDVRTDLLEWSVFIQERVNKLDFDALILGWSMGIDPDLYQIWHSSQTGQQMLNFVGFKNQTADDLIVKIRQEYNHDKQVAFSHKLHEIIAHEQPYTFLYVGKWTAVLDKRIVIKSIDASGKPIYEKIKPTLTGNYTFDFNKWIKLPEMPQLSP